MRRLVISTALALLALSSPAAAGGGVSLSVQGDGYAVRAGSPGKSALNRHYRAGSIRNAQQRPPRRKPHRPHKRRRPVILYPVVEYDWAPPAPLDPPETPPVEYVAPPEPEEEALPPDPAGGFRILAARHQGAGGPPPWEIGEPLPGDLPHVLLDARLYDLPEPPPGQIYVRVRHDVLLIEAYSRRVMEKIY